jgi:hypothetical protein
MILPGDVHPHHPGRSFVGQFTAVTHGSFLAFVNPENSWRRKKYQKHDPGCSIVLKLLPIKIYWVMFLNTRDLMMVLFPSYGACLFAFRSKEAPSTDIGKEE